MNLSETALDAIHLLNAILSIQGSAPHSYKIVRPFFSKNKEILQFQFHTDAPKKERSLSDELSVILDIKPSDAQKLIQWCFEPLIEQKKKYRSTPEFFSALAHELQNGSISDSRESRGLVILPKRGTGLEYLIDSDRFKADLPKLFEAQVFGKHVSKILLPLYEQQILKQQLDQNPLTPEQENAKNTIRI